VGTAKRERQKANRQVRLEEMAKQAQKKKMKKRGLLIGIGIPALLVLIFIVAALTRNDDDNDAVATTVVDPAASTVPVDSTAPVDAAAPVTVTPVTLPAGEATPCPEADGSSPRVIAFAAAPPTCIDPTKTYTAEVTTNLGAYTIALDPKVAPNTVNNFVVLARYHYFDNTICHRAITDFMVQCGDPTGTGTGGPGYEFANENPASADLYIKGSVSMANSGADTNGSQFFIATSDQTAASLGSPSYSLFGQVTDGLDTTISALNALGSNPAADNGVPPSSQIVIQSVTITEA
jgi:cyclophilin family peptidyl-prolyl cis-trans isomerase